MSTILIAYLIITTQEIYSRDNLGRSVLMYAVENGHAEVVKTLSQSGADGGLNERSAKTVMANPDKSGSTDSLSILRKAGAKE